MSEYEELKKRLDDEKNKLMQLEIEINSIDSDTYFYQRKNDFDKLNQLSEKKETLTNQFNIQKELVNGLESKFNSIKSKHDMEEKRKKLEKEKEAEKIREEERIFKEKEAEKIREEERIRKEKEAEKIREEERIRKEKDKNHTVNKTKFGSYSFTSINQKKCKFCGALDDGVAIFCPNCGKKIREGKLPKEENWFVKIFLKKKKDDGSYRFSISKIIGVIYAILEFLTDLFSFTFPENIIISIISAAIAYLICLIIGYVVRWAYNKYIK